MTAVPDGASRVRMPRIGVSTSRLASLHELNLKECDEAMLRGEFDPTSLITQSRNDFKIDLCKDRIYEILGSPVRIGDKGLWLAEMFVGGARGTLQS